MMHGDISNIVSSSFGFRLDGFLLNTCSPQFTGMTGLINYLKSRFGSVNDPLFNQQAVSVMSRISLKTEYSTPIIVDSTFVTKDVQELVDDNLPYSSVIIIEKQSDVTDLLNSGIITYYVDDSLDRISATNSPYAYTLNEVIQKFHFAKVRR